MINIGFMIGHVDYIPHAKLLIGSIVKNMDTVKSVHIFAMTPRDFPIKIGIYGVTQITFDMPKNMVNIPFADKMFAASKFESLVEAPYLWMDVDGYFFKEPNLISDSEISVNPVDQKNIGDLYEGQL